jgi:adenine phosphoribosyltransferase
MKLKRLYQSLLEAPIVKKGEYDYVVHPITDGVPEIRPELLEEITVEMKKRVEACGKFDKLVTMEAMGIPLATALSQKLGLPFTIIRKRSYGLPGEVSVEQVTGYSKSHMYVNGLKKGDRIVIVDDVLSTGGTLRAILQVFHKMGIIIKGIVIVIDKGNVATKLEHEFNVAIDTLVTIDVVDGKVVILA